MQNNLLMILYLFYVVILGHCNDLEVLIYSLESPTSILCLTETWLSDEDPKTYLVKGYTSYLTKNRNKIRAGVMIQVCEGLSILEEI